MALIGKVVSVSVLTDCLFTRQYLFYTGRPGKISSSKALCTGREPSHYTYDQAKKLYPELYRCSEDSGYTTESDSEGYTHILASSEALLELSRGRTHTNSTGFSHT